MGTADRDYRITVTGTRKRSGEPAPLRTFLWDNRYRRWSLDTQYLNDRHLGKDDPAGADKMVDAIQSRGRLGLNRDTWHLAKGVVVPIRTMSVILDAASSRSSESMVSRSRIRETYAPAARSALHSLSGLCRCSSSHMDTGPLSRIRQCGPG